MHTLCKGCAVDKQHKRSEDRWDGNKEAMSMDYMYMTRKKEEHDIGEDKGTPVLVMVDRKTGMLAAQAVKQKGVNDYAGVKVVGFMNRMG